MLPKDDDIAVTILNPNEEYKSVFCFDKSVLAGLSPDIVSEICSRALSFWQYQTLQEFKFQQLERKEIEEKKRQVERKLNQLFSEAKSEIASINEKYNGFE